MKNSTILISIVVVILVILGVYLYFMNPGNSTSNMSYNTNNNTTTANGNNNPATPTSQEENETIKVATNQNLGKILTDSKGKTVYMFMSDYLNKSNCYGQCAQNWPPVITSGAPNAGENVSSTILTYIMRSDGKKQVAYNGRPLYYWQGDAKAGDINGQDIGKKWFVVTTDGSPIQTNAVVTVTTNAEYGKFLTDGNGWTQYIFTVDTPSNSKCYGVCAVQWPPLLTLGAPTAGAGVDPTLLATITRQDGTKQVTYKNQPLYYWFKDNKPGDTTGQNIGKVWFVINPNGTPNKKS